MLFAAVLAGLVFAAPANAAPIPIRHDRDAGALALAGPDILVLSEDKRGMKLVAVPRTGGRARTVVKLPGAQLELDEASVAASAQRVGVVAGIDRTDEYRVYSGPPSGPLQLVRRTKDPNGDAWTPYAVSVDGDRMLLLEGIPQLSGGGGSDDEEEQDAGEIRAQILDSSGWHPVPWASSTRVPVAIAGAYALTASFRPQRLELVDMATGTSLAAIVRNAPEGLSTDLAAGGAIAAGTPHGIEVASASESQHILAESRRLSFPRFAGGTIAAFDDARSALVLRGADGAWNRLGPRSSVRTDLVGDAQGVAWLFNGCVRYEPLGTSTAAQGKSPCPASEVGLYTIGPKSKLRGNTARVPVRCVASETGRCRGRLVVRLDYGKPIVARGTFNLPANDRYISVPVHFNRRTVALFHRQGSGGGLVNAILRNGTVGTGADYAAEFSVEVDERS
jgi:hypothetical protein